MAQYRVWYLTLILGVFLIQADPILTINCPFAEKYLTAPTSAHALVGTFEPSAVLYEGSAKTSANPSRKFLQNYFSSIKPGSLTCGIPPPHCSPSTIAYRTFDGSCNNLQYPDYGMAKSRYTRLLPPKYGDGVYAPSTSITGAALPNARQISLSLYGEQTLPDNLRTLTTLHFGQLVAHDMSRLTTKGAPKDCCSGVHNNRCYPISLASYGPIYAGSGKTCMHFARATSDLDVSCPSIGLPYIEKISLNTGYLDLSVVYGHSLKESEKYRQFVSGLLKTTIVNGKNHLLVASSKDECSSSQEKCYSLPDGRNQFTPTIAILHLIFVREHNRLATGLQKLNPHYSDEQLYQEARKINIALFQKFTYYDWLPLILGHYYSYANGLTYNVSPTEYINDYDESVNVNPYASFSAAAFRYSHNQIPGFFSMVSPNRHYNQTMRLSTYFNSAISLLPYEDNFDGLIRGLCTQYQKRADSNIDREIKHYLIRKPNEEYGSDLKAFDIQRGRDFGLPSYNDFREYVCGLPRAYDWSGFSNEISIEKIVQLKRLYASPDDVDLSVGGSLESHLPGTIVGPTFQCIIGKQFLKTRTGDRFFFENENLQSGFTREQLAEIRKVSLSSLFCNNGDYIQWMQPNPFIVPIAGNGLQDCATIPSLNLAKWQSAAPY